MSKKISRLITLILFAAVAAVFFFNRNNFQKNQLNLEEPAQVEPSPTTSLPAKQETYEFVATVSGEIALDLVQSQVKLDLKEYDFGTMVEGVNDLKADTKHYWALYQNGDYAKVGIADVKLEKGEKIELRYEEITL